MQEISHRFIRTLISVQYKSNIILLQGGELMDERNNDFDFDFMPIGQAIKKAREARGMTREQLAEIIGYAPRHIQSIENEGQHPSIALPLVFFSSLRIEYKRMAMFFAPAPVILAATSNPSKLIRTICSAASPLVFIRHQLLSLLFFICPYGFQFFLEGIVTGLDPLAQFHLLSDHSQSFGKIGKL